MDNSFYIKPKDQVTIADASLWTVVGFKFEREIRVILNRMSDRIELPLHKVRTENGVALLPGNSYSLQAGTPTSKFAIFLRGKPTARKRVIEIVGQNSRRKLNGTLISKIRYKIYCGTQKAFDEKPEVIKLKLGEKVKVRSDSGGSSYYGLVSAAGHEVRILDVAKPERGWSYMSTIKVDYNGVNKNYRIHRFIDSSGNMMQWGWQYNIERLQDYLIATPVRTVSPDKVEWSDSNPSE